MSPAEGRWAQKTRRDSCLHPHVDAILGCLWANLFPPLEPKETPNTYTSIRTYSVEQRKSRRTAISVDDWFVFLEICWLSVLVVASCLHKKFIWQLMNSEFRENSCSQQYAEHSLLLHAVSFGLIYPSSCRIYFSRSCSTLGFRGSKRAIHEQCNPPG